MHGYTAQDVARLHGLTPAQIRSWTRAGFLTPARGPRGGDAEGHYHAALAANAEHATAWYNLGTVLEDEKQLKEAISAYAQAIRADPKLADAYFNLSRLYEKAGKRAAALRCLSKYKVLAERE